MWRYKKNEPGNSRLIFFCHESNNSCLCSFFILLKDTLLISTFAKIGRFFPNRVKIRLIRVKEKLNPVM
jgi:hypothetical protein